jgi:diketogulonate reductase-like aldo/keto reductase
MNESNIPNLIYGTAWKKERTADLVAEALKEGFRAIDTACQPKHYYEPGVGQGIEKSGLKRSELFLQTKFTPVKGQDPDSIPYNPSDKLEAQIKKSLEVSFNNLKTDYLDSLILHSPLDTLEETLEAWEVFESFVNQKKVRYLGISNCYHCEFFIALHEKSKIKPRFLQNRFYQKSNYDKELRNFCRSNSVFYQSFWTLTANPHLLESKILLELAKKYKVESTQILYRALTQWQAIPLIGTTSSQHMRQDLAIFDFVLEQQELHSIELKLI